MDILRNYFRRNSNDLFFIFMMWASSRLLIVLAMSFVAPLIPAEIISKYPGWIRPDISPAFWKTLSYWDSKYYLAIAESGYEYIPDGKGYNIAFFPIFPILIKILMSTGIPADLAGFIVNNSTFLGALFLLYFWVFQDHGKCSARWATIALAWSPFSLFGTVVYTEGVFLFLSTLALRSFDQGKYAHAGFWGALVSATRVPGSMVGLSFLFTALTERKGLLAYLAGIFSFFGVLAFSLFCAIKFGDFLAFVRIQSAWSNDQSMAVLERKIINYALIAAIAYLFWKLRKRLPSVAVNYGFFSLFLFLVSGNIRSINRFLYGMITLSFGLGILFERYPRLGYTYVGLGTLFLMIFSVLFCWGGWVA